MRPCCRSSSALRRPRCPPLCPCRPRTRRDLSASISASASHVPAVPSFPLSPLMSLTSTQTLYFALSPSLNLKVHSHSSPLVTVLNEEALTVVHANDLLPFVVSGIRLDDFGHRDALVPRRTPRLLVTAHQDRQRPVGRAPGRAVDADRQLRRDAVRGRRPRRCRRELPAVSLTGPTRRTTGSSSPASSSSRVMNTILGRSLFQTTLLIACVCLSTSTRKSESSMVSSLRPPLFFYVVRAAVQERDGNAGPAAGHSRDGLVFGRIEHDAGRGRVNRRRRYVDDDGVLLHGLILVVGVRVIGNRFARRLVTQGIFGRDLPIVRSPSRPG